MPNFWRKFASNKRSKKSTVKNSKENNFMNLISLEPCKSNSFSKSKLSKTISKKNNTFTSKRHPLSKPIDIHLPMKYCKAVCSCMSFWLIAPKILLKSTKPRNPNSKKNNIPTIKFTNRSQKSNTKKTQKTKFSTKSSKKSRSWKKCLNQLRPRQKGTRMVHKWPTLPV